jgi:hypothetical protein
VALKVFFGGFCARLRAEFSRYRAPFRALFFWSGAPHPKFPVFEASQPPPFFGAVPRPVSVAFRGGFSPQFLLILPAPPVGTPTGNGFARGKGGGLPSPGAGPRPARCGPLPAPPCFQRFFAGAQLRARVGPPRFVPPALDGAHGTGGALLSLPDYLRHGGRRSLPPQSGSPCPGPRLAGPAVRTTLPLPCGSPCACRQLAGPAVLRSCALQTKGGVGSDGLRPPSSAFEGVGLVRLHSCRRALTPWGLGWPATFTHRPERGNLLLGQRDPNHRRPVTQPKGWRTTSSTQMCARMHSEVNSVHGVGRGGTHLDGRLGRSKTILHSSTHLCARMGNPDTVLERGYFVGEKRVPAHPTMTS